MSGVTSSEGSTSGVGSGASGKARSGVHVPAAQTSSPLQSSSVVQVDEEAEDPQPASSDQPRRSVAASRAEEVDFMRTQGSGDSQA